MNPLHRLRGLSLLVKCGLVIAVPIVLLAVLQARGTHDTIEQRAISHAKQEAQLLVRTGERSGALGGLRRELDSRERARLDRDFRRDVGGQSIAGVRLYDRKRRLIYANGQGLGGDGRASSGIRSALHGRASATVVKVSGTRSRRPPGGVSDLLIVSTPWTPAGGRRPVGVMEVLFSYRPLRETVGRDSRRLNLTLYAGLALIYALMLGAVAGASKRFKSEAAEKSHLALHDSLTGLPNRMLFRDLVEKAIVAAKRRRGVVAVMLMDLDRFKEINDTLGHFNGDQLLQRIGSRLRAVVRDGDRVARLGGDEFAVVVTDVADQSAVAQVAERILKTFEEPFVVGGLALEVEASIGIALYPEHGKRVSALMQAADVAMYVAKDAHSGLEFYSADQHQYSPDRLALIGELRRAIDDHELVLHYQPKLDLRSGLISGVEALARWEHPRRGLLSPAEFIPLAEHTSLIKPVTLHLLDSALSQCRRWREEGIDLSVAVNLSMQNLLDFHLPDDVFRLLAKWSIEPRSLELEITESMIMSEPRRAMAVLERLNDMGVRLTVDDFGTGYSSLSYLKELPVSCIKIDKSFVMTMEKEEGDAVIVQSTVALGKNLGMTVVAEGVEGAGVLDRLAAIGCDYAQGYYLSKALPAEKLTVWLSCYRDFFAPADKEPSIGNGSGPHRGMPSKPFERPTSSTG